MKPQGLQNCGKCGLCLSVCPVYKELVQEHASPRARLQLIKSYKNNNLLSSPDLKEIISKCLMCGACKAICPSGINHYSQFMEMREQMARNHGEKPAIKSLVYLLAGEYRIKFAAGVAKFGQRIIPQTFFKKYNLGNIPVKRFPRLNKKPFRQAVPEVSLPQNRTKGTVLYFTGCATNYIFENTGFSTLNVLKQLGYKVIIPAKQTCCGIPMLFHGAGDQARKNILTNIDCLDQKNITAIIVDCPTCATALKHEYPALLQRLGLDDTAALRIASRVVDIMSFILKESDPKLFSINAAPVKVTYHLPCHLKNSQKTSNNTEKVFDRMAGLDYIRASDVDECCGGGGTFFYEYPDLSKRMVDKKVQNAKNTGARTWLTDCPVCRINLSGNLTDKADMAVKHPVEIINRISFEP